VIIENVRNYTCILPVFAREVKLAAVNNRMPVGEGIYMTVNNDPLADTLRIFQIITPLYIIADIIPNNDIIRVA